jgi:hypothetical protein
MSQRGRRQPRTLRRRGPGARGGLAAGLAGAGGPQAPREPSRRARQEFTLADMHDPARGAPEDIMFLVVSRLRCRVPWIVV